MLREVRCFYGR